jgi:hypothetical protein
VQRNLQGTHGSSVGKDYGDANRLSTAAVTTTLAASAVTTALATIAGVHGMPT